MRLGYASLNTVLRAQHIFTERTARVATILREPRILESLFAKNLADLRKILEWNVKNHILLYRIGSEIAPHITNTKLMSANAAKDYRSLVFNLNKFARPLADIGQLAKAVGMRLTMHPEPFYSFGSPNPTMIRECKRMLYFHNKFLDMIGLDDSVIVLHGGGTYGNKKTTMQRWIKNFNATPRQLTRRVVIENDERSYSIADILSISGSVKFHIPVVLDFHHYYLYNQTILRISAPALLKQPDIEEVIPMVLRTWTTVPKFHISDPRPGARFGAHDDYVKKIPPILLKLARVDVMVEAKMKEQATLRLMKKYKKFL
jgi:UV DNA damage endonuclease